MIFRAFDELTYALPAVFSSQLSPADAAKLLARESERVEQQGECVIGRVDGSDVVFQRYRRFSPNPCRDGRTRFVGINRSMSFIALLN